MDPISAAPVNGQFDMICFECDCDNVHRSVTVPTTYAQVFPWAKG